MNNNQLLKKIYLKIYNAEYIYRKDILSLVNKGFVIIGYFDGKNYNVIENDNRTFGNSEKKYLNKKSYLEMVGFEKKKFLIDK